MTNSYSIRDKKLSEDSKESEDSIVKSLKTDSPEQRIQKIQSEDTLARELKIDQIINTKIRNLSLSLKEIAKINHCSYSHARRVWAKYQKKMIQKRGSPLPPSSPFSVHGSWKEIDVPESWLLKCPLELSANRNGQRVWKGDRATVVFHKKGNVKVYAYYSGWDQEVRDFLSGFLDREDVDLFFSYLQDRGSPHVAFHTPMVPKNFKLRIRGVGTLSTDTTPYRDGTTEFVLDPELLKRVDDVERLLTSVSHYLALLGQRQERESLLNQETRNSLRETAVEQGYLLDRFGQEIKSHLDLITRWKKESDSRVLEYEADRAKNTELEPRIEKLEAEVSLIRRQGNSEVSLFLRFRFWIGSSGLFLWLNSPAGNLVPSWLKASRGIKMTT